MPTICYSLLSVIFINRIPILYFFYKMAFIRAKTILYFLWLFLSNSQIKIITIYVTIDENKITIRNKNIKNVST